MNRPAGIHLLKQPSLREKVDKFLYEKDVYTRIDQKFSQKSRR